MKNRVFFFCPLFVFTLQSSSGQDSTHIDQQEDLIDVVKKVYHKIPIKPHTSEEQIPVDKVMLWVVPAPSYSAQTKFQISLVGNAVFRKQEANVSSLISDLTLTQKIGRAHV